MPDWIAGGFPEGGLHIGLLFAPLPPPFTAEKTQSRPPRCFIEPGIEDGVRAQAGGFAREDDKDGLRDFLGVGGNPGMAERRRINQVDMPPDQFGKGFLRALPLVIPQQVHVAHIGHLTIHCRWDPKSGIYFLFLATAPDAERGVHAASTCETKANSLFTAPCRSGQ